MANEAALLAQILSNNVGQRLTPELATGIVAVFAEQLPQLLAPAATPARKPRRKKDATHADPA